MPNINVSERRVKIDWLRGLMTGLGAGLVATGWALLFGLITRRPETAAVTFGSWLALGFVWAAFWPVVRRKGLVVPSLVIAIFGAVLQGILVSLLTRGSLAALILTGLFNFAWFIRQYRGR